MDKQESNRKFGEYRKRLRASINGRKGNLVKLSQSNLLSKREKEIVMEAIAVMEKLSVEMYSFKNKPIITATQEKKRICHNVSECARESGCCDSLCDGCDWYYSLT